MTQLTLHNVHQGNPSTFISGNDVFLNFFKMSFVDIEKFLNSKSMRNKGTIFLKFSDNIYIDELFLNDKIRTEFENFVFNLIEKRESRFIFFSFKIKEKDMDILIHNGFYEWLDYWMLFVKFTHINFTFEMNDDDFDDLMPMTYQIVKKIENPRATIFINTNSKKLNIPEDVNAFTIIASGEQKEILKKYPYASFCIQI